MKTTIRAMLTNLSDDEKSTIDHMMLVFCTAVRVSFKRLLEGNITKGDLEKQIAVKYNLNIRQSKDAVENARQIIASQKELLKEYIKNYSSKVKDVEKTLSGKKKLSTKRRNKLLSKLDKRKRRLAYFQSFVDKKTIPPVTFGGKDMFIKRCKGLISNQEWKDCRNNRFYSRGDKAKKGNPNLRVVVDDKVAFLEISTLEKIKNNRSIKIQVPIYLPQKLSKKTGKINGTDYRKMFLNHLQTGEAYQVELLKRNDKYYAHITFESPQVDVVFTGHNGIIGIDTNPDGFALTMIDNKGNYKWSTYFKNGELQYARSNRRENLCGELAKQVVMIAKTYECGIAIEDLKFKNDKDVGGKFSRIKHQFVYSKLLKMLESSCIREGVEIVKVKPQFTSKIGLYKYCHQYGMDVHNGAAMVVARRSYKFKEKISKILKNKLVKNLDKFNKKNEWSKWSEINKNIKKKVGEKPDSWIVLRKKILRSVS